MGAVGGFEYGITMKGRAGIHRNKMTREQAEQFVSEWLEDGGPDDIFTIVRRPVGEWEPV